MTDLGTTYLGLELAHPVVASASPLSRDLDGLRRMEDGGASAVVLFSLFEELIRREREAYDALLHRPQSGGIDGRTPFPTVPGHSVGPEAYLELLWRASKSLDIPVIASLNGATASGWTGYARRMEEAGAAAIELNIFHIPADVETPGTEVEARYLDILERVRGTVSIPVAVKLSPYFSALGHMARSLVEAGADGLVLFNRFYQPDIDLEALDVEASLELSAPPEIRLPLLWISILHGRIDASLAATSGVETGAEVMKYVLAGADVVMTTSALLRHGPQHAAVLRDGLAEWLERKGYGSVAEARGRLSQMRLPEAARFERTNYLRILEEFEGED